MSYKTTVFYEKNHHFQKFVCVSDNVFDSFYASERSECTSLEITTFEAYVRVVTPLPPVRTPQEGLPEPSCLSRGHGSLRGAKLGGRP